MPGRPRLRTALGPTVSALVHEWSVASVHQARRNAMVACTACAERRAERQEVAEFLAARAGVAPATDGAGDAPDVRRAAHR